MATMRFNHMELTLARGTLTDEFRKQLDDFYGGIFGWRCHDIELLGGRQWYMEVDDGSFLLVAEHDRPMSSPGYDHLGLLMDTRAEVDHFLGECKAFAEGDDRVRIKEYEDLVSGDVVVHAFYVKYLLPIWFDVQVIERGAGAPPRGRWVYEG
jgi:hypothetical protein